MYFKNIITTLGVQVITMIYGILTSIMVARALGPVGQGDVAFIMLIITLISNYAHLGVNDAIPYISLQGKRSKNVIYSTNLNYLLIIFTIIIIFFTRINNMSGLKDYNKILITIMVIFIISNILLSFSKNFFIINEEIYIFNKINFYSSSFRFIGTLLLLLLSKLSIETYLGLYAISIMVQVVTNIIFLKDIKYKFILDRTILKAEFSYGIILFFASLFIYLNYKVDQLMIKSMIGTAQLGVYSIGVNLAELAFLIPQSVTSSLLARIINKQVEEDKIERLSIKYTVYITAIIGGLGIIMSPALTWVYGDIYKEAEAVVVILFIGIISAAIGKIGAPIIVSKGKAKIHLVVCLGTLILNIILNFYLIPEIGIKGAAIASSVSYIFYGGCYTLVILKMLKIKLIDLFKIERDEIIIMKKYLHMLVNKKE